MFTHTASISLLQVPTRKYDQKKKPNKFKGKTYTASGRTFAYIYSICQMKGDGVDTTHTCHFNECLHSYSIQE
jgi:hypothetical protein